MQGAVLTLLLLGVTAFFSISLFSKNHTFSDRLAKLQQQLKVSEESLAKEKKVSDATIFKLHSQVTVFEEKKRKNVHGCQ